MVVVRQSNIHGKGAFALKNLYKDEILECDVLEVTKSSLVENYVFVYTGNRVCIHIGWASFLNSSRDPNLHHLGIDIEKNVSYFKVLKDILIDEELTLRY